MMLCPTQSKAGMGGAVLLFFWGIPASQLSLSQWKFYFIQRADHLQYYRNGLGLSFLIFWDWKEVLLDLLTQNCIEVAKYY